MLSSNNELKSDNEQAKNVDKKQLDTISEENEHLKEENLFLKNQIEDKEKQIKKLSKNHPDKSNDNIELSLAQKRNKDYTDLLFFLTQNIPDADKLKESNNIFFLFFYS